MAKKREGKEISGSANTNARIILIVILVAIVLALVLVLVSIAVKSQRASVQPDGTIPDTKNLTGYAEPDTFDTGKGLWFKGGKLLQDKEISAEAKAGTPVLEFYYDYTCNACMDYEELLGKQLDDLVQGGKAVVVMRPTLSHNLPYASQANSLLFWTATKYPDKTWKLQKSLMKYGIKSYTSKAYDKNQNNETWKQEALNPQIPLQRIAQENGIDFTKVPPPSAESGGIAIKILAEQRISKLGGDPEHVGTPLYIANGKIADMSAVGKDKKLLEHLTL